jgi:hypothetical protein
MTQNKYDSYVFQVLKVTEDVVYDSPTSSWEMSNFEIPPKKSEFWCIVKKYGYFHMAFKVE